ncbi:MAG: VWA domain-containing protein [Myxococcales bacterium]|nr:VWA domain-containing protein [Myxococcales bacterium]
MKSWQSWFRVPRVRRGLALGAVVLSCGGLVLYKAPAEAKSPFSDVVFNGKNGATFGGPGLHGSLALSHTKVMAGQTSPVFAEVRLGADKSTDEARQRAPIAMAVVLDTSGSMSGEKIVEAKRAVLQLIRDMRDDDMIAFVRYSDSHELVQPLARVGDVRRTLEARVEQIRADGGTRIAPALAVGRRALDDARPGFVKRMVLVSDGLDDTRPASEATARASFGSGVTVSSLGVGLDFDESYMGSVAMNGHGNFAFVKDGASIGAFLRKELVETSSTTIEHAKVRVRIPAGMTFVRATGADARVDGDEVELSFGALYAGDERRAVEPRLQLDDAGESRAVTATATWDRVGGNAARVETRPIVIAATRDGSEVERGRDGAVLASATSVIASQRQLEAAQAYTDGDVKKAEGLILQNLADLNAARAAAPAPAAAALDKQARAYEEDEKTFRAGPSDQGRTRAKAAAEKNIGNLTRKEAF